MSEQKQLKRILISRIPKTSKHFFGKQELSSIEQTKNKSRNSLKTIDRSQLNLTNQQFIQDEKILQKKQYLNLEQNLERDLEYDLDEIELKNFLDQEKLINQEMKVANNKFQDEFNKESQEKKNLICRICLDSLNVDGIQNFNNQNNHYLSPCNCKGESKYVHKQCLNEWIYVSKRTSCQVCLVEFKNVKLICSKKSFLNWIKDEYEHLFMFILYMIPVILDFFLVANFTRLNWFLDENNQFLIQKKKISKKLNLTFSQTIFALNENENLDENKFSQIFNLNLLIYNIYFIKFQFMVKNFFFELSSLPITLFISVPSIVLFMNYCRIRFNEWQKDNYQINIQN